MGEEIGKLEKKLRDALTDAREHYAKVALGLLTVFAVFWILSALGNAFLAMFSLGLGLTTLGARVSKYKLQLELFNDIMYFASVLIVFAIIGHATAYFGYQLSPKWMGLVDAATSLEIPLLVYAFMVYSFHPTRPGKWPWIGLLIIIDGIINPKTRQILESQTTNAISIPGIGTYNLNYLAYLAIALGIASIGVFLVYRRSALWGNIATIYTILGIITGAHLSLVYLHKAGIFLWLTLPPWVESVAVFSSASLLGSALFFFIVYMFTGAGASKALALAGIWALAVYGPTGMIGLVYLAVFSIAVWVLLAIL